MECFDVFFRWRSTISIGNFINIIHHRASRIFLCATSNFVRILYLRDVRGTGRRMICLKQVFGEVKIWARGSRGVILRSTKWPSGRILGYFLFSAFNPPVMGDVISQTFLILTAIATGGKTGSQCNGTFSTAVFSIRINRSF